MKSICLLISLLLGGWLYAPAQKQDSTSSSQKQKPAHYWAVLYATAESKAWGQASHGSLVSQSILCKVLYDKYYQISDMISTQSKDTSFIFQLQKQVSKHDSIINTVRKVLNAHLFLEKKISRMDSLKKMQKGQQQNLIKSFINKTMQDPYEDFERNFDFALQNTIQDTVYYAGLYKNRLHNLALSKANIDLEQYSRRYKITIGCKKDLEPILIQKGHRLSILELRFPQGGPELVRQTIPVNQYYDSVITRLLIYHGASIHKNAFTEALFAKKYIELNDNQIDTLIKHSFIIQKKKEENDRKDEYTGFDAWQYERKVLLDNLTNEQFRKFIISRNSKMAMYYAQKDWYEIKYNQLADIKDSLAIVQQVYNYHLAKRVTSQLFEDNPSAKQKRLDDLESNLPDILQQLNSLKRKKSFTPSFSW